MSAPKVQWTPALREQVLKLWQDGKTSGQIAEIMGEDFTKNMILGRLYHHGHMRSGKASEGIPRSKSKSKGSVRKTYPETPLYVVHPMWGMDDDDRRKMITNRAQRGAAQALREASL